MLINREKPNVTYCNGVYLMPGTKEYTTEQYELMKDSDYFKHMIEKKDIEIIVPVKDEDSPEGEEVNETSSFDQLNAKQAIKVIADMGDVKHLEKIVEEDERKSVVKAAEKQLEKLREEDDKED